MLSQWRSTRRDRGSPSRPSADGRMLEPSDRFHNSRDTATSGAAQRTPACGHAAHLLQSSLVLESIDRLRHDKDSPMKELITALALAIAAMGVFAAAAATPAASKPMTKSQRK